LVVFLAGGVDTVFREVEPVFFGDVVFLNSGLGIDGREKPEPVFFSEPVCLPDPDFFKTLVPPSLPSIVV